MKKPSQFDFNLIVIGGGAAAKAMHMSRRASEYGVKLPDIECDFPALI